MSWVLTLAMLFSMLPVSARAAASATASVTIEDDGSFTIDLSGIANTSTSVSYVYAVVPAFTKTKDMDVESAFESGSLATSSITASAVDSNIKNAVDLTDKDSLIKTGTGNKQFTTDGASDAAEVNKIEGQLPGDFLSKGLYQTIKETYDGTTLYDAGGNIIDPAGPFPYIVVFRITTGTLDAVIGVGTKISDPNPTQTPADLKAYDLSGNEITSLVGIYNSLTSTMGGLKFKLTNSGTMTAEVGTIEFSDAITAAISGITMSVANIDGETTVTVEITDANNFTDLATAGGISGTVTIPYLADGDAEYKTLKLALSIGMDDSPILAVQSIDVPTLSKDYTSGQTATITLVNRGNVDAYLGGSDAYGDPAPDMPNWTADSLGASAVKIESNQTATITVNIPDGLGVGLHSTTISTSYGDTEDGTGIYWLSNDVVVTVEVQAGTPTPSIGTTTITNNNNSGNDAASGKAYAGDVLTVSAKDSTSATISSGDLDYAWTVGGVAVSGNNSPTYTVQSADELKTIRVTVTPKTSSYTGSGTASVDVLKAASYSFTLSADANASAYVGYTATDHTKTVTITNTGDALTGLSVAATNGGADFDLVTTGMSTTLADGSTTPTSTTFTVTPKSSLSVGTHTGVFTVSTSSTSDTKTFTYTFTVNAKKDTVINFDPAAVSYTYDGNDHMPTSVTVTADSGETTLTSGTDYNGVWTNSAGTTVTELKNADSYTYTVTLTAAGETTYNAPAAKSITITKKAAAAAPGLTGTDPTSKNGTDGSIKITDYDNGKSYEYQKQGDSTWTSWPSASNTLNALGAGTYLVREKYDPDNQVASATASQTLTDPTKFPATLTIQLDDVVTGTGSLAVTIRGTNDTGFTKSGTTGADGKVTFTDLPNDTYTITVAGMTNNGIFEVKDAPYTGTLNWYTLTVNGGAHSTTPSGNGKYLANTPVSIGVTNVAAGWTHTGWTITGDTPSSNTTVTITQATSLTATYEANKPNLANATLTSVSYGSASYSDTFAAATNGDGNYTYAASGLPDWLELNSVTRTISLAAGKTIGTVQTYNFTVTATCNGKTSDPAAFTLTVSKAGINVTGAPAKFNVETGATMDIADIPVTGATVATSVNASGSPISNTFGSGGSLAGTWSVSGTYLSGDNNMTLTFTPTDTTNYSGGTLSVPYTGVTPTRSVAVTYTKDGGSSVNGNSYTESVDYLYDATSTYIVTFTNDGNLPLYNFTVGSNGDGSNPIKVTANGSSGMTLGVGASVTVTLKADTGANATEYSGGTPYTLVLTPSATEYTALDTAKFTAELKVNPIALTVPAVSSIVHATTIGGHEGSAEVSNASAYTGISGGVTYSVTGGSIDTDGKITGLSAGSYKVTVTPVNNTNYTAATSASFIINDGTKYTGTVKVVTEDDVALTEGVVFKYSGNTVTATEGMGGEYTAELDTATAASYEVWANGVNTGKTVSASSRDAGTVNFYKVKIGKVYSPENAELVSYAVSAADTNVPATTYADGALVLAGTSVTFTHNYSNDSTHDYSAAFTVANAATGVLVYSGAQDTVDVKLSRKLYTIKGIADGGVNTVSISGTTLDGVAFGPKSGTTGTTTANSAFFTDIPAGTYSITATLKNSFGWKSGSSYSQSVTVMVGDTAMSQDDKFTFETEAIKKELTITTVSAETDNSNEFNDPIMPYETVTVTNTGNVALTGVKLALSGDNTNFAFTDDISNSGINAAGIALGVGESVTLKFTRTGDTSANVKTATLSFTATEGLDVSPTTKVITLTITAIPLTGVTLTSDKLLAEPKSGDTLTANITPDLSASGLTSSDVTYKWFSGGVEVNGESGSTYQIKDADEGKIIRVEVAGKNNASGTQSAATSAVWYTGNVTVKVGGVNDTTGSYTVVAVNGGTRIPLTYSGTDGVYTSGTTKLNPALEYTIEASISNKDAATATKDSTLKLNSVNGMANTLNYRVVAFSDKAAVVNKGTPGITGDIALTAAAAGVPTALATGDNVLDGTTVAFTAASWGSADYSLSWANTDDDTKTTSTNTVAYGAGRGTVAATLTQNTYTVVGTITQLSGGGTLDAVTMTDDSYTYTTGSSAGCTLVGNDITMTVVKAAYTIAATPHAGTAIISWTVNGSSVTAPASINVDGAGKTFGVTVDGESYKLKVSGGSVSVDSDSATKSATKTLAGVTYGYGSQGDLEVTVENIGNMPLYDVTLSVTPSAYASFTNDAATALTDGTASLAVGAGATFKVTPNTGMNTGTHTYTLTLNANKVSGDASTKIEALAYVVSLTVSPLALDGTVAVTNMTSGTAVNKVGDTLSAAYTGFNSAFQPTDYVINWYSTADSTVLGTGATYTIQSTDQGKTLYAKVEPAQNSEGTYNATGSVQSGNLNPVEAADYTGKVAVNVDGDPSGKGKIGAGDVVFIDADNVSNTVSATYNPTEKVWESGSKLDSTKTYKVQVKGTVDDATIILSAAKQSVTLDYYTVTFGTVTLPTPAASKELTVTMEAKVGGNGITTGSIVYKSTVVTFGLDKNFPANENGLTYDYETTWGGGASGSTNTVNVTYDSVKGAVSLSLKRAVYTITGIADNGIESIHISGITADGAVFTKDGTAAGSTTADSSSFVDIPAGSYTITAVLKEDAGWATASPDKESKGVTISSASQKTAQFDFRTTLREKKLTIAVDMSNATKAFNGDAPYAVVTVTNTGNVALTGVKVSSGDSTNFVLSDAAISGIIGATGASLAVGSSVTFTITRQTDLNANAKTATLTFEAAEGLTAPTTQNVTLTITAIPLTGVTLNWTEDINAGDELAATITPSDKGLTDSDVVYTWTADGTQVGGNSPSYVVQAADAGKVITVSVSPAATSNASGGPVEASTEHVNFTGKVTVNVDGVASGKGKITSVVFVDSSNAETPATLKSGVWESDSALNGEETYSLKVNGVAITGITAISNSNMTAVLNFYTVDFADVTRTAGTYDTLDKATITAEVTTLPTGFNNGTATGAITTGTIVPEGTVVTFTIDSSLDDMYDYKVTGWDVAAASGQQADAKGAQGTVTYVSGLTNGTVTATLAQNTYTVTGSVTPADAFTSVTISGTTAEGVSFSQPVTVTDGTPSFTGVPKGGSYTISYALNSGYTSASPVVTGKSITENTTGAFSFAADVSYTVSGNAKLNGSNWATQEVSWGGDKVAEADANGNYSFTVTADAGAAGKELKIGGVTAETNMAITTDATKDYTFYTVTVVADANGNVTGSDATTETIYKSGASVNLVKAANPGYQFTVWEAGSQTPPSPTATSYTVPSTGMGPIILTANFEQIPIVWSGVTNQTTTYGADFSYTIPAITSGYNVTFSVSGAPDWLSLDGTNTLSGKPPVIGTTADITVTATSGNGLTDSKIFTITVNKATPSLSLAPNGSTHYQGDDSSAHITSTLTGGVYYNGDPATGYNVSNWVTLTAADLATADALTFTPGTLPADGKVTVSVDGSKTSDVGTQTLGTVWNAISADITLTMATTQNVTVSVTKNGSAYDLYDGKNVTVTGGAVTRTGLLSGNTVTIPGVPTGTYTVSIEDGTTLSATVGNVDLEVSFDYYAVSVDATDTSVASASISTLDSGHMAEDGVYLKGSVLSLTATAKAGYQQSALTWEGGTVTADGKHTVAGVAALKPVFTANAITFANGDLSGKVNTTLVGGRGSTASATDCTFTYALKSGETMPKGLTLNADGTVAGTPTKAYTSGKQVVIVATASPTGATAEATWTFTIDKAEINAAAVTVDTPEANGANKLADGAIVTGTPNFAQVTTWSTGAVGDTIAYGTVYTATVTLTPTDKDNYKFVAGTYTINGVSGGANVTVNVADDLATLAYTFPPTAPDLSVVLEATSFDTATATPTSASSTGLTVEYIIKTVEGEPSDWTGAGTSGSFDTLASYTTYYVYARAKVTVGGVDSAWSAVVTASDRTFHKVTVDGGTGTVTEPITNAVGVDDGATLAIQVTPPANHKFTNWTTNDTGNEADITSNANPGQYGANSSSAAEVTLTANYEAGYGVQYDANGGTGTVTDSDTYYASESVTAQANAFTHTGYTFKGWNTKADGNGTSVVAGNAIPVSSLKSDQSGVNPGEAFILYAQWEMNVPVIAAPSDGTTTYGATGYSYSGLSVSNSSNLANTVYAWTITGSENYGMSIDHASGVISGRAAKVGDIDLTVTVSITDGGETKTSAPVTVKIVSGKADIAVDPSYAAGTYYAGEALDTTNLSGTVTAPYWSGTEWDESHDVTGNWSFDTATKYIEGNNVEYDVTYTASGTDAALYNNGTGTVEITAITKTYGLDLVNAGNTGAAEGTFANGVYLDSGDKAITFKVQNTGNQPFDLDASSYVLTTGTHFEIVPATGTVPGTTGLSDVVTVKVKNPGTLTVGAYTDTLTVTSSTGQTATLALSYTVGPKEIPSAAVTGLAAPAKGGTPTTAGGLGGLPAMDDNGKIPFTATVTWTPGDTTFLPGKEYEATVVLTADSNYYFAADTGSNYTIATQGTAKHTVDATTSTVTFTEGFGTVPMAAPTPDVMVTDYHAGTVTITGQDAGATVKFLVNENATATAAEVWSGTAYTGADQALPTLSPNTTYYIHAVAGNDAGGTVKSAVTTVSFKTPYEVVVKTDSHGTVAVNSGTATSNDQPFSVYANTTDAGTTGIPTSLSLAVSGNSNYTFHGWTDTASVISGAGPVYTLVPSGTSGTITVTANFAALYTIAFDANGGTDGTLPTNLTDVKVGDTVTLPAPSPAFTRDGYESGNGWAINTEGTGMKVTFGDTITITDAMLGGISAGGTLTFYHVWKSLAMNIELEILDAVYNMAQSDWTAAPSGPITINNGSGTYSGYTLSAGTDQPDPTDFLEITSSGVIQLKSGARMGDAGTYKFTVSVHDDGKNEDTSAVFTLTVAKATPQITAFTYAVGTNYYGDDVVQSGKITATVTDQYDAATVITAQGGWKAVPSTFQDKAGGATSYTFTFEVTDDALKGNYNTANRSASLASEERAPGMAVATLGKSDHSAAYVETNPVTYNSAAGTLTVTAEIKNTGNDVFDSITVTETRDTDNLADNLTKTGITLPLAVNGTATFTFDVALNKDARTAPYEAAFTIVGRNNADGSDVTITYTYQLEVAPVELDHATLNGLTAPAADGTPVSSVTKADDAAYNALYTVKSVTWTGDMKDGKFRPGVAYTASITLEPTDTTNYVFVGGTYKLDDVVATTSGTVSYKVNSDGTLTITHTYDVLAVSGVTGVLTPVDYSSAAITSLRAESGVTTRLYYALFATEQSTITAAQVKAAAQNGSYNSVSAIQGGYGHQDVTSTNGVAQWTGTIPVSGLTGGSSYYLYVAAQPLSEAATANGLAMGNDTATLGKLLTVKANAYGKVTYSTGEVPANGSVPLTMDADKTFAAVSSESSKFGFVKWTMNSADTTDQTYNYVLNDRSNGDTLSAIFHRKLNGSFTISGTLGAGGTLTADLSSGKLFAGDDQVTDTAAAYLSYQWSHSADGITWSAVASNGTGSSYTIPSDGTYAGHFFQLAINYTDPDNGGNASTVSAETGAMTLKLDKPAPNLETAQADVTSGASTSEKAAGGLYVSFPKASQDMAADQKVEKYLVTLTKDGVQVGNVEIVADGSATYSHAWPANLTNILPGDSFTVSVVAVALGSNGYNDSEPGTDTAMAGRKTLTLADLTGTLTDKVFNGAAQTGGSLTAPTGAGTPIIVYANDAAGNDKTADKTSVNTTALQNGAYTVYVSVSQGDLYLGLAQTVYTDSIWAITQADTILAFTNSSLAGKNGMPQNLATGAAPKVTYASATAGDEMYETSGTITDHYILTYAVTASPTSDASDYELNTTTGAFTPKVNGAFTITVTAAYKDGEEDQFKADLAVPASKTFTVEVQDKVLTKLEILSADRTAIYGMTNNSIFYDAGTAANAKQMSLEGVQLKLTWDNGTDETITLDASGSNAGGIAFTSSLAGSAVTSGKVNFPAAGATVITAAYLGQSDTISLTLSPKLLNYHTTGADKVYDGNTTVTNPDVAFDPNQVFVTNPTVDAVALSGLISSDYVLSSASEGTRNVQIKSGSMSKLTLGGMDAGYYALGTLTPGTVLVTAAVIDGVKVTTQTPTAGATIVKTVDGMTNKVTDNSNNPLAGVTGTPTITWQEKDSGGTWKTTTDTTFQPGKEYRPVVIVTVDGNHKLEVDGDYTINGNGHNENNATITVNSSNPGNTGTFTGTSTALPITPVLRFEDEKVGAPGDKTAAGVNVTRSINVTTGTTLGAYTITLSNAGEVIYDVEVAGSASNITGYTLTPTPATIDTMPVGGTQAYTLDLSSVPTSAAFSGKIVITARGAAIDGGTKSIEAKYTLNLSVTSSTPNPGGGGGGGATELTVTYDLMGKGTSKDALSEAVASGGKPANVPTVTSNNGYSFKGWSQDNPGKVSSPKLVDPKTVVIKADTTFYAVYGEPVTGEHEHYIKGYDTGIFGPADNITRSQVAAIIARACLDGFHEDTDYGNGGYIDVADDHWARSAIAFVTAAGVFEGDGEGHFDPDRPITRQEFALVFARMVGLLETGEMPFSDADTTADWAIIGVYTAYAKGWVNGYEDGTFKPWNNIARSEAVKIVNRYLGRGVDAKGIVDVYSELKQWPDVPSTYWAYYEILEASNDHTYFYVDGTQPPEMYTKAYIEAASWGK